MSEVATVRTKSSEVERNRTIEILTPIAGLASIVGFGIYNSALPVQVAVDFALKPLIGLPIGSAVHGSLTVRDAASAPG